MIATWEVAIGLGSNLGDCRGQISRAAERLAEDVFIESRVSSLYSTPAWGKTDQPDFLNAVIVGRTEWRLPALANFLQSLENELGRTRREHWGPREIDLDLLLVADMVASEPMVVPHPGLQQRQFVLAPLVEIWPGAMHPIAKRSVAELYRDLLEREPACATVVAPPPPSTKNL